MTEKDNKTEMEKLEAFDPTDFSFEIRIKLETLKQLKRIADTLDLWTVDQALEVSVKEMP